MKEENWQQLKEGCPSTAGSLEDEVNGIMGWVFRSNNTDFSETCDFDTDQFC